MIGSIKDVMSQHGIRNIYFDYFHVHLGYDLILWGWGTESEIIFKLQKQAIQICNQWGGETYIMQTALQRSTYTSCSLLYIYVATG
jgi:hypothetical protein